MTKISRKLTKFLIFLLLICSWMFNFPTYASAETAIDPQLEQQVLQIIREHPDIIIQAVQNYQKQQRQQQINRLREPFLYQTKTNPKSIIGDSPFLGSANAKVLLVEFSDFQCPYCAKAHQTIKAFMAKHGDEVTLTYKHLPLTTIHPQAMAASQAAYAAQQQGKFWQYHDVLFEQQKQLGEKLYLEIADDLNLDIEQFNRDRKRGIARIQKDMQLAQELLISGTPFFILGNRTFSGALPLSQIEAILAEVR